MEIIYLYGVYFNISYQNQIKLWTFFPTAAFGELKDSKGLQTDAALLSPFSLYSS